MKLDNKGFAITSILYAVLILFLSLIVALLVLMGNRKLVLDKYKAEVKENLNNSKEAEGARIQFETDTSSVRIYEDEFSNYDFKSKVSGCLHRQSEETEEINTLCNENETDITELLNYKIYDESNHEVIDFNVEKIVGENNFSVDTVKYTYYDKDEFGNYKLSSDGKSLKIITTSLEENKENIFFIKYNLIDNNNLLAKEVTRSLFVSKYNKYINLKNNYFEVNKINLLTYDFKLHADSYKLENDSLIKDNSLLNYAIFNSNNERVLEFKDESNELYYTCDSDSCKENGEYKNILVDSSEKFHVKYFTGSLNNPTSEVKYAYFTAVGDMIPPLLTCMVSTPSGYEPSKILTINASNLVGVTYSWNNENYSEDNTRTISETGTFVAYVKDSYGQESSCSINIVSTTEYREASCAINWSNDWHIETVEKSPTSFSECWNEATAKANGRSRYYKCEKLDPCETAVGIAPLCFKRTTYRRYCSIGTCGEYGSWQLTPIQQTSCSNSVQTRTVYKSSE